MKTKKSDLKREIEAAATDDLANDIVWATAKALALASGQAPRTVKKKIDKVPEFLADAKELLKKHMWLTITGGTEEAYDDGQPEDEGPTLSMTESENAVHDTSFSSDELQPSQDLAAVG